MNLKRGTKVFLQGINREPWGPFKVPLVRQWISVGLLSADALVLPEGSTEWVSANDVENIANPTEGMRRALQESASYFNKRTDVQPASPRQHAYFKAMGCPFDTSGLENKAAWQIMAQLAEAFPEKHNPADFAACEQELDYLWRNRPATEKQRAYLNSIGANTPRGLTVAEASRLIGGDPTEGQLRRLRFYGIKVEKHHSKDDATAMIDSFVAAHPESEAKYQAWKQGGEVGPVLGEPDEPASGAFNTPEMHDKAAAALYEVEQRSRQRSLTAMPQLREKPWWKFW